MSQVFYSWAEFDCHVNKISSFLSKKYSSIYGIPRGGIPLAIALSQKMGIPLVNLAEAPYPGEDILVCDDILDSGRTRMKFAENDFVCLHRRQGWEPSAPCRETYYADLSDKWIVYPWELEESAGEDIIVRLLQFIGEDPNRAGLVDTPKRVIKMYQEFLQGYDIFRKPKMTVVPNGEDGVQYDEMLDDHGYFFSFCEHHILPFFGEYYFSYIPDKLILGASKIGRIVDYYAGKLQIAERLVNDIADEIEKVLQPQGLMLIMRARHLCKEMRGLKKWDSPYEARAVRGFYKENRNNCKMEFLARINKR